MSSHYVLLLMSLLPDFCYCPICDKEFTEEIFGGEDGNDWIGMWCYECNIAWRKPSPDDGS